MPVCFASLKVKITKHFCAQHWKYSKKLIGISRLKLFPYLQPQTCLIICFFTGDLVALFDDDDIDELKQERNEVEYRKSKSCILAHTFQSHSLKGALFLQCDFFIHS